MIIAIDANEANVRNRVGVNVYAKEILQGIYKLQDKWKGEIKFLIYLKEKPLSDLPLEIKNVWEYKVLGDKHYWIIRKLMPYLLVNPDRADVLFTPSHYTTPISRIPRVISIMDLGYLNNSEHFTKNTFWQLKYWTANSIYVSKRIIAISEATKKDIVRHYPRSLGKIEVTHLAYDSGKYNLKVSKNDVRRIKNKYRIVDDYILFLGTLKPSKNIDGLIEAFSILIREKKISDDLKLVIAGKKGWLFESIFKKVKDLKLKERVIFTDFVEEEDKPALYKGARVFVSPSKWEGFGMIALEAMACGTPVVLGNRGSIPEIVGEAGVLCNPENPRDIAEKVSEVISLNQKMYNNLVEKSVYQAQKFSWEKTARKTLEILKGSI